MLTAEERRPLAPLAAEPEAPATPADVPLTPERPPELVGAAVVYVDPAESVVVMTAPPAPEPSVLEDPSPLAVVVPLVAVSVAVTVPELPDPAARASVHTRLAKGKEEARCSNILWQKPDPTEMIDALSASPGHDSLVQSRTPLPKSMFLQRHPTSFAGQPRLGAFASMLLIQFFCLRQPM